VVFGETNPNFFNDYMGTLKLEASTTAANDFAVRRVSKARALSSSARTAAASVCVFAILQTGRAANEPTIAGSSRENAPGGDVDWLVWLERMARYWPK
jgi:hypothetical protein